MGSNRTFMELKYNEVSPASSARVGSNRTFMELKLIYVFINNVLDSF